MSCLYCCFRCCAFCGCRDRIINNYAFYPPPPSYEFRKDISQLQKSQISVNSNNTNFTKQEDHKQQNIKDDNSDLSQKRETQFSMKTSSQSNIKHIRQSQMMQEKNLFKLYLKSSTGEVQALPEITDLKVLCMEIEIDDARTKSKRKVAGIYIENQKFVSNYIIIFSHGNSTDIGYMLDSFLDLAYNCKINIFSYDYCGYGQSKGKPSDFNIMQDIVAVYNYVRQTLKYEWDKIILYGQSLGSGPSTFLAARFDSPIGGLIIHSGFTSGIRILHPNPGATHYQDFFPNTDIIKFVNCPVFIIHGTEDKEINISHAKELYENAKNKFEPFFPEGAGHNNIEVDKRFRRDYFFILREYLDALYEIAKQMNKEDILKANRADIWLNFNHQYTDQYKILQTQKTQTSSKRTTIDQRPSLMMVPPKKEIRSSSSSLSLPQEQLKQFVIKDRQQSISFVSHAKKQSNAGNEVRTCSATSVYAKKPQNCKEIIQKDLENKNFSNVNITLFDQSMNETGQNQYQDSQVSNIPFPIPQENNEYRNSENSSKKSVGDIEMSKIKDSKNSFKYTTDSNNVNENHYMSFGGEGLKSNRESNKQNIEAAIINHINQENQQNQEMSYNNNNNDSSVSVATTERTLYKSLLDNSSESIQKEYLHQQDQSQEQNSNNNSNNINNSNNNTNEDNEDNDKKDNDD